MHRWIRNWLTIALVASAWSSLLLGLRSTPMAKAVLVQQSVTVWVNRSSGVYHCPGTRYYGATRRGEFMREADARAAGYRPAYGRVCGAIEAGRALGLSAQRRESTSSSSGTVWVNLSSHVYHCPGTRYYGATKRGVFMSEGEAQASGHRPAYGRQCN